MNNNNNNIVTPKQFICPLTLEIMKDPVIDIYGNTYEKSAIVEWLRKNNTSPLTRGLLNINQLIPNRSLLDSIEEFKKNNTQSLPTTNSQSSSVPLANVLQLNLPRNNLENIKMTVNNYGNDNYHCSIKYTNDTITRNNINLCCVIDISGSMATEVSIKNSDGIEEKNGLSQLDLVKHAVKTIIHSLKENDNLSLITFNNAAKVICDLTQMTNVNKKIILEKLDDLFANGSTNLWHSIKTALDVVSKIKNNNISSIFILTDGVPNIHPPKSYIDTINSYKNSIKFECQINMFGFGSGIDSILLQDIASTNNGMYSFISDASLVGTSFINSLATLLSTVEMNMDVKFIIKEGYAIEYASNKYTSTFTKNVGFLTSGQTRDFIVKIINPVKENVVNTDSERYYMDDDELDCRGCDQLLLCNYCGLHYRFGLDCQYYLMTSGSRDFSLCSCDKNSGIECIVTVNNIGVVPTSSITFNKIGESSESYKQFCIEQYRLKFVQKMKEVINYGTVDNLEKAKDVMLEFVQEMKNNDLIKEEGFIKDLIKDISNQVIIAFSRHEYFTRWGLSYLLSLSQAHALQICNNFKDASVQHYGKGELFNSIRNELDNIFINLPPPIPSVSNNLYYSSMPVASMSSYHNSSNVCIFPECEVLMADDSIKLVKDIRKGDVVKTILGSGDFSSAVVTYVIKSYCTNNKVVAVSLIDGLKITPWHPIKIDKKNFIFPYTIATEKEFICDAVYSFALDKDHVMIVNNVECITLGHGFTKGIEKHSYFGTSAVLKDLEEMDVGKTGFVEVESKNIFFDNKTNVVCKIKK